MTLTRLKHYLEVFTNIVVVLVVVIAVALAAKQYLGSKGNQAAAKKIAIGTLFPAIPQINYGRSPKTLILALNVSCRFCIASIPFYQRLAQAQQETAAPVQIVAIFLNKEPDLVSKFAKDQKLSVTAISSVDFPSWQITFTPTVVLVDSTGKVLNSWSGQLTEDEEKEVFGAIDVPYKPRIGRSTTTAAETKKTVDVFDEGTPLLTIEPETTTEDAKTRFVNNFDVDSKGTIYLLDVNSLLIYDALGKLISSYQLPNDFRPPFCVDDFGQIYAQGKSGLSVYSSSLAKVRDLPLNEGLSKNTVILKVALDRKRNNIYAQAYNDLPLSQKLYKVDLRTQKAKEVFELKDPVPFNPTYSPGAFDFTLGSQNLYVSDIREYRVFVFSLLDGSLVKTFTRPFTKIAINQEDAKLPIRKATIGGLGGTLRQYPPIFHLSFTNRNRLLVWTSKRDKDNRQVVDVYDQQMNFLGVDLKYAHPGSNSYVFVNNKVYAPDFGSGKEVQAGFLSPLEVPSRPIALKVFAE